MHTLVIIIVVLFLFGGIGWGYNGGTYRVSVGAIFLVVVVVLYLLGVIH
jgi:hypothetical protein